MNIDKNKLLKDLRSHKERMTWNCQKCLGDYEKGYLQGIDFAIRAVELQEDNGIAQVTFDFDCAWK